MTADYNNFSLNKGKAGKIDLENLKGGLKREQLKDKNLLAIFDAIDDGNHILDAGEISNLKNMLKQYAKNTNLSKREAKKYLESLFGKQKELTITNEDLFKFINGLNENSKNVKSSNVIEQNGHEIIQTEYKDGTIEKYNPDEGKRIIIRDNKTSTYDKDNNLLSEEYFDKSGNAVKTIYENQKPLKTVTDYKDNSGQEIVFYNEDGAAEVKTVQKGSVTDVYEYTENGERLVKKVENGVDSEDARVSQYAYNEDGSVIETIYQGNLKVENLTRNGEVVSSKTREQRGENVVETVVDEEGNVTENTFNKDGGRIKQIKTVDGQTYTLEYDGNGNTYVVVQNGESIEMLAKHFGVDPDKVKELNPGKVKGRGNNKYFLVGEEVLIPKELEADDKSLRGRNSSEQEYGEYEDMMKKREELRRKQREEEQRLQDEVKSRKPITFTSGQKTFEALARQLYKQEGVANPSERQLQLRIEELKKYNPKIKDGELQGKKVKAGVPKSTYDRVVGRQKEVAEMNRNIAINKSAAKIAENLYDVCDDNAAAINKDAFWKELNRVNSGNIIQVLDNYDKVLEKHPGDSSLVDTICSEVGASASNRKSALTYILNKMAMAARKAGVKESDITKAKKDFTNSMNEEFAAVRRINPTNMEKALDFLRGAAVGAKLAKDTPEVSTKEAMNTFVHGSEVQDETGEVSRKGGLVDFDKEAQKTYKDAREAEGWVAKTGDWVCGLFGCTTIDDMDKKLGKHAADAKKLAAAAESGNEAEFKKLYKQIFGIDFNPKTVAARQTAQENYEAAVAYDSSYKAFAGLEKKTKNMDYAGIRNELKSSFDFKDEEIDALIAAYAESKGFDTASDADKKYVLDAFIRDSKQTYLQEYHRISKGKSLEQMNKDLDLLTKAAYGTNDIVKDVVKFNENQQMTEMVTSAALEIAGTIALQFVPGLGQMAAARLAVSAAKWGAKGVKVASIANKAYKAASVVTKAQNASKKAQIATQMINAGVATAAVNLSDKKSVEETLRKTLMNMSFAGVGATSSVLAPKLMQSFGIADKAIANELAEEIINMAGSYGITKLSGSDYGAADGFIDMASGLIMSRISHIKTHKPSKPTGGSATPPSAPTPAPVSKPTAAPSVKTGDDAPAVVPPKPVDEGGGSASKTGSEGDSPAGVEKPSDSPVPKPAEQPEVSGPTPEHPQVMKIFGMDTPVIKIEINKQGQKVLHTAYKSKITLDLLDRPIIAKDQNGNISTFEYANYSDIKPSKTVTKDKKNQILSINTKKGDTSVQQNFNDGKEYILNNNGSVISERIMKLSDYPAGAKVPDPDVYSENMKKQIDECTSIDKLNDLKYEYSMYNSQYGKTEDLFKMFSDKDVELSSAGKSVTPHQPQSKLVTSTTFDNALQNLNLKKYGKKGIPLKYSHESFMKDLNDALNKLSPAEKDAVMNNLNIKLVTENGKVELADIPKISTKAQSQAEQDILDILNKYAKQNEIQISDPALKAELENFIKDVPEFSFMIGKPQNGNHSYSLDSHTLQNLQKALKYADDANLSDESKEILKMSILLHDIGKQFKGSAVSDTGHAVLSKKYAEQILERFDYPQDKKDKILNLIENHHWFKEFNKGNMSAEDVVKMFGDDLPLAKAMAKADLESVSDDFHLSILEPGKKLTQSEYETKINEKMNSIDNVVTAEVLGLELPIGQLENYKPYMLDYTKADKLVLGNNVELDLKDPKFQQLVADLKEGESFAVGCINPKTTYDDVKYQIGMYEEGVGSHHLVVTKKHGQIVIEPHKNVSVLKSIPTAKNNNPVIAKKIEELRNKATSITTKTFNIDGKQVPFEVLHGTQGGSNKGYYVINKQTGELFYAKFGGPQGKTEVLANKLYEMAGVNVPEMSVFHSPDGTGTLSKYVPELSKVTSPTANANDGFGMDVLLANWDVVGTANDNLLKTSDGKVVRLDAGGTFDYRAQGANKPYTAIPTEITTLLNPKINPQSAAIFGNMTRDEMIKSLNKAVSLKDSEITKLLDNMGLNQYKETLLKRKKFLKSMLEEMKNTPQGNLSMLEYMQKISNSTMDKFIVNAKSLDDLEDAKLALKYVNDISVKNDLISKIENRKKYLEATAPPPKQLSEVQVQNILLKSGFNKIGNSYQLNISSDLNDKLVNYYGYSLASKVKQKLNKPLDSSDIQKLTSMINVNGGKYISLWQKDPHALVLLYQNIKNTHVFSASDMTPAKWDVVLNIAKTNPPVTAAQKEAFEYYKGCGYTAINTSLENAAKGMHIAPDVKQKIDQIQSFINTQVINEPIKVKRGEGYEVLNSVTFADGTSFPLAAEMQKALQHYFDTKGDKSQIEKLKNFINKKECVATQEHFMSATMAGPMADIGECKPVHWDLLVEKGSKGAFLEGINFDMGGHSETEILLQKDSKIVIQGIDFDYNDKKWKLIGTVSN